MFGLYHYDSLGTPVYYDSLMFRFTFISGVDTSGKEGWMIDNMGIIYQWEGIPVINNSKGFNLFPNPASDKLIITSHSIISQISIMNLFGQQLYSKTYNEEKVQVDISELPPGMYFVKVNGVDVKRFVKQ